MPVNEFAENPAVINLSGTGTITMAPAAMTNGIDTDTAIANPSNGTNATQGTLRAVTVAGAPQMRNLPAPSSQQIDTSPQTTGGNFSVLMVLLMVAMLAGSVMLSSAPASRVRRPISQ